jgi:hypothetical protein
VVYSNLRVILTHMFFNHYASLRSFIQGDHNTYFIATERFRRICEISLFLETGLTVFRHAIPQYLVEPVEQMYSLASKIEECNT